MSVISNNVLAGAAGAGGAAGYTIDNSLRFNSTDSSHLTRTVTSAGSRRKFTFSYWVKKGKSGGTETIFSVSSSTPWGGFYVDGFWWSLGAGDIHLYGGHGAKALRDPSAWYHCILAVDTDQADAANRVKVWINGVSEVVSGAIPSVNYDININEVGDVFNIGGLYYCDLLLAEFNYIDGQQLSETDFGEFDANGVWQPIEYAGTYGTNGFYLPFNNLATPATVCEDASGNNNHFTPNNITALGQASPESDVITNASTVTYEYVDATALSCDASGSAGGADNAMINCSPVSTTLSYNNNLPAGNLFDGNDNTHIYFVSGTTVEVFEIDLAAVNASVGDTFSVVSASVVPNDANYQTYYMAQVTSSNSIIAGTVLQLSDSVGSTTDNTQTLQSGAARVRVYASTSNNSYHQSLIYGFKVNGNWLINGSFTTLTLASNQNLTKFSSGDAVTQDSRYTPETDLITAVNGTTLTLNSNSGLSEFSVSDTVYAPSSYILNEDSGAAAVITSGGTACYFDNSYSNYGTVRSTSPLVGKVYWEVTVSIANSMIYTGVMPLDLALFESNIAAVGYEYSPSVALYTGTNTIYQTYTSTAIQPNDDPDNYGGIMRFAYDSATGKLWMGTTNGWWNSGDPANGTGEIITLDKNREWVAAMSGYTAGTGGSFDFTADYGRRPTGFSSPVGRTSQTITAIGSSSVTVNGGTWSVGDVVTGVSRYGTGTVTSADTSANTISLVNVGGTFSANTSNYVIGPNTLDSNKDVDTLFDSPTNGDPTLDTGLGGELSGNYATLNPLTQTAPLTITNGNLEFICPTTNTRAVCLATLAMTEKTYWEVEVGTGGTTDYTQIGIIPVDGFRQDYGNANIENHNADAVGWLLGSVSTVYKGSTLQLSTTPVLAGGIASLAFDPSTGNLYAWVNGVAQNSGNPVATVDSSKTYIPAFLEVYVTQKNYVNFGQRPFAYSVAPAGYKCLCTANLPDPDIADGSTAMDVVLYNGTGTTQSISGLNFSPDLVWTKNRGASASHAVYDIVRGAGNLIRTNETTAEVSVPTRFTSFNSDGYTIGSTSTENNASSNSYVAWAFDGGSSTAANTDGSISSSVRANASAGFSIVSYTGNASTTATVGHGLGVSPAMILVKNRDTSSDWCVAHIGTGDNRTLKLNTTDAKSFFGTGGIYSSTITSTTFQTNVTGVDVNATSDTFVAYCWAPVEGYSAFGSYTGNGSADGPFVYTGFRPRWIMIKIADTTTADWVIYDTARDTYNVMDSYLTPNLANAEYTATFNYFDITSNGFKIRNTNTALNYSGATFIWAAFAESPFKYARAR